MLGQSQVKAVLCAALYPNAAVMDEAAGRSARPAWNDGVAEVHVHPSSIVHGLEAQAFARPYLVYLEKARTFPVSLTLLFAVRHSRRRSLHAWWCPACMQQGAMLQ
jgi:hypothetical protein